MKFEYKSMDLAVYRDAVKGEPTSAPHIVIETKTLFSGLQPALSQAKSYAAKHACRNLVIATDGVRYLIEGRGIGRKHRKAYMNLLSLRDGHPYDRKIEDAKTVFESLLR